jgi:hypothetical protein
VASRAGGPHAGVMISGRFNEHAALVALLRAQSDGLGWPEIAAQLLENGSAPKIFRLSPPSMATPERRGQGKARRSIYVVDG